MVRNGNIAHGRRGLLVTAIHAKGLENDSVTQCNMKWDVINRNDTAVILQNKNNNSEHHEYCFIEYHLQ